VQRNTWELYQERRSIDYSSLQHPAKTKVKLGMDALKFEYPDYERLNKGAEGVKRKRIVNILNRQAARMVKEDEKVSKKRKSTPEPKVAA
jgi:hypothetical protein